jgi:hypothetical protein
MRAPSRAEGGKASPASALHPCRFPTRALHQRPALSQPLSPGPGAAGREHVGRRRLLPAPAVEQHRPRVGAGGEPRRGAQPRARRGRAAARRAADRGGGARRAGEARAGPAWGRVAGRSRFPTPSTPHTLPPPLINLAPPPPRPRAIPGRPPQPDAGADAERGVKPLRRPAPGVEPPGARPRARRRRLAPRGGRGRGGPHSDRRRCAPPVHAPIPPARATPPPAPRAWGVRPRRRAPAARPPPRRSGSPRARAPAGAPRAAPGPPSRGPVAAPTLGLQHQTPPCPPFLPAPRARARAPAPPPPPPPRCVCCAGGAPSADAPARAPTRRPARRPRPRRI